MSAIRSTVLAVLDKVSDLLNTEPARVIGYGAAVVVWIVIQVLNARGITRLGTDLSFEEAVAATVAAMALLAMVIESIRRFVYSPMSVIEEVADAFLAGLKEGHVQAHAEEAAKAEQAAAEPVVVAVGPAPVNDPSKPN